MKPPSLRPSVLRLLVAASAALVAAGCIGAEGQAIAPDGTPDGDRDAEETSASAGNAGNAGKAAGVNPWVSCYGAFQPSLDPATDLARLTDACAKTAGLQAVTQIHVGEPQTDETPTDRLTFLGRAGRCYRVFSIGEPGVGDLDVAILDDAGQIAAADVSTDRWPIVPTSGPLCLQKDQRLTIHAAVVQGSGAYLMQVWGNSIK